MGGLQRREIRVTRCGNEGGQWKGTPMKTIIGVNGACGRMGQRIVHLASEDKTLAVGAALEAPGHPCLGKDIGEVVGIGPLGTRVTESIAPGHKVDALIDFSTPEGTLAILPLCKDRRIGLLV